MPHVCPVCGFPGLKEAPRSKSGGGSYEICPSCGFQFGVDDDDKGISPAEWRQRWEQKGSPWYSQSRPKPKNWNPAKNVKTKRKTSSAKAPSAKASAKKAPKKPTRRKK